MFHASTFYSTNSIASSEEAPLDFPLDDEVMSDLYNFSLDVNKSSHLFTGNELEKDSFSPNGSGLSYDAKQHLLQTTNQTINQIDSANLSMVPVSNLSFCQISGVSEKPPFMGDANMAKPLIDGEAMWFPPNIFNLLEIGANDIYPTEVCPTPAPLTANPTYISPGVKVEPVLAEASGSSRRSTRKTRKQSKGKPVQTSPTVKASSMAFQYPARDFVAPQALTVPMKTELNSFAPSSLNVSSNQSRGANTSSSVMLTSPIKAPVKKRGGERRKFKYDSEDLSDPKVVNAKNSKRNREKNLLKIEMLETQITNLTAKVNGLEGALKQATENDEHKTQRINFLLRLLKKEKSKNAAMSANQKVTMYDLMRNMVSVVQPQPAVIFLSERLGAMPMPDLNEMNRIRAMHTAPQPSSSSMDNYLTVKVGIGASPSISFGCENGPQH